MRFAVVGCGQISSFHTGAIASCPDAVLSGVYDALPGRAEELARRLGIAAFPTLEAIAGSPDVDAVCVCTPSGLPAPVALQMLAAGKHVLVEKPLALTESDCDRLIDAARQGGLRLGVISQLRFSLAVRQVKRAMDAGAIGRLVSADLYMKYHRSQSYYDSSAWRGTRAMDGGGALMNQGIHGVDLLQYLAGPVESIFARSATLARNIEVEDTISCVTSFKSGALGVIEAATSLHSGFPRRLELLGDAGTIVLEEDRIVHWDVDGHAIPELTLEGLHGSSDPMNISREGHERQIANFAAAILGREELLIDGAEGKKAVKLILSAYRSASLGLPVKL